MSLICLSIPIRDQIADDESENTAEILKEKARQSAYADDLTGSGTIRELKVWWDLVVKYGPFIGYYAKPTKSWLIVKEEHLEDAKKTFKVPVKV